MMPTAWRAGTGCEAGKSEAGAGGRDREGGGLGSAETGATEGRVGGGSLLG